jgi:hypothetical protein
MYRQEETDLTGSLLSENFIIVNRRFSCCIDVMMIQFSLAALSSNPCKKRIKIISKDQRKVNEEIEVE